MTWSSGQSGHADQEQPVFGGIWGVLVFFRMTPGISGMPGIPHEPANYAFS